MLIEFETSDEELPENNNPYEVPKMKMNGLRQSPQYVRMIR